MIPGTADDYLPSGAASRGTVLSFILAAHVAAAVALASIGSVHVIVKQFPMQVQLVPEAKAPRPEAPARSVPLPEMRLPDIRIPPPPPFETIAAVRIVEEKPAPAPVEKAMPSPQPPAPAAPPAIEPPRFDLAYLDNPAPVYPIFAKRAKEQGVVMLRVRVDAAGAVEGIDLHKSSGSQRLDDAALAAVKRWRFVPARSGERAVAGVALVPVHFQLETP